MLIITGTIAYDYIMDFPGKFSKHILPEKIHNINVSFIVNKFDKRRGGTAGNVSYTLGLLQTPNILFSTAGKDFPEYQQGFRKLSQVDLSHVVVDKKKFTATGFAMTDKSDNQIWGYFYGAAEGIAKLHLKDVLSSDSGPSFAKASDDKQARMTKGLQGDSSHSLRMTKSSKDFVLIGPSGAVGSMAMVRQCVQQKVDYMFDPGFILTQVSDKDLALGVQYSSYIIGNDYEINLMKKRIRNWSQLVKNKTVITTLGDKGATIVENSKTYTIAPVKPKAVVDPTGAGDAWRGGFLAGMERGLDIQTCGQMGSVASAYAIEQYGTQEHVFTIAEFKNRYRQSFGKAVAL